MAQVQQSTVGEGTDDPLAAFVEERAGEALRAVAEVERADYAVHYLREDLQYEAVDERMNAIHGERAVAWSLGDDALAGVGEKRATVEMHDEAVVVHLLVASDRRYVLEFEYSAARNLTSFLGDCFRHAE